MAIKTDAYYASCTYDSPVGMLTLAASEEGLKGLWLNGQKYFAGTLDRPMTEGANDHLDQASHWLDAYFARRVSCYRRTFPGAERERLSTGRMEAALRNTVRRGTHLR